MDIKFDTLKYLVNCEYNNLEDTKPDKESQNLIEKNDKKFYKKRLISVTKQLFKKETYDTASTSIKLVFDNYLYNMIEIFKSIDLDEARSIEYKSIIELEEEMELNKHDDTLSLLDYDIENIKNQSKQIKIEDCFDIKKKNKNKKKPILPEKKKYNLKTEKNKKKKKYII